jgi:hypothetical protein
MKIPWQAVALAALVALCLFNRYHVYFGSSVGRAVKVDRLTGRAWVIDLSDAVERKVR